MPTPVPYPPPILSSVAEFPTALQVGEIIFTPAEVHSAMQNAAGGIRTTQLWTYPAFMFEVQAMIPDDYLEYLMAFYLGVKASGQDFLFQHWLRPNPLKEMLGVGDGTTTVFKAYGDQFDSGTIYLNGVATYSVGASTTGFIALPVAPALGVIVLADIVNEKFRVKFMDTQLGQSGRSMMLLFRYGPFEVRQAAPGALGYNLTYRLVQNKQAQ